MAIQKTLQKNTVRNLFLCLAFLLLCVVLIVLPRKLTNTKSSLLISKAAIRANSTVDLSTNHIANAAHLKPSTTTTNQRNKRKSLIFQIGFGKCSTKSLFELFVANRINSIHFDNNSDGSINRKIQPYLDVVIAKQYRQNRSLLEPFINRTIYYSFMKQTVNGKNCDDKSYNSTKKLYQVLNEQYDDKYNLLYIMNIRNVNHWLRSFYMFMRSIGMYTNSKKYSLSDVIDVLKTYKKCWYSHHCNFLKYVIKHCLMHNTVVFD
eukprot:158230_1